jgi:DNA-binding transcriptional MerR regulator
LDKAADAFRTISEVADELDVPQHVLRFWESRFAQIKPMKRGGGRRYYRPEDVDLLRGIRHLLYGEGYTIKGVQGILRDEGTRFVQTVWQEGAERPPHRARDLDQAGEGAEGGRGLLGLIPSLRGREGHEEPDTEIEAEPLARREPPLASAPALRIDPAERPAPTEPAGLSREDARRLQATLHELTECRRLIDATFDEKP